MYDWELAVSISKRFRSGTFCWDFLIQTMSMLQMAKQGPGSNFSNGIQHLSSSTQKNARLRPPEKKLTSLRESLMMMVFKHWKKHLFEACSLFITVLVNTGDPSQKDMVFAHEKLFINLGRQDLTYLH